MKLYAKAGACSMIPHTALEWSKAPYELELVDNAKIKSPEYLALNPQGTVPLLQEKGQDGDFVLSQNVAILQYLNASYPQAKLFGTGDSKQQAKVWYWLAFLNSDLHKTFGAVFHAEGFVSDETAQQDLMKNSKAKIVQLLEIPNTALQNQDYLTGELTIVDVYLYVMLRWAKSTNIDISKLTNLEPFFARVESNEGVQAVIMQENLKPLA